MKQHSFFYFLVAGVVVLLLTAVGGCTLSSSARSSSQITPAAAMFVSKQAPVMVSLLGVPERLEAAGRRTNTQLKQLRTSLLANTDLDYERDIQPWLGDETTLAVTTIDIDRNQENGQQPGYLLALATKDAQKSREFLQLVFSKQTDLLTEQYKGVQLVHENPQQQLDKKLSGAVVGNRFVLFANHPQVLKEAINNIQAPDLNLASSSQYQQALTQLPNSSIGLAFLNLPKVATWRGWQLQPQTYESQIIALELKRKGLLASTAFLAVPEREATPAAPTVTQQIGALQYIPSATGFSISGYDLRHLRETNLNQLWLQVAGGSSDSGYDVISRLIAQPLAALRAAGIDLQKDIFSWVEGEYALGLLPHPDQTAPDWIFVAETTTSAALTGISSLDAIASQQGLSTASLPVASQEVSAWTKLVTASTRSPDSNSSEIALKAKVFGVHTSVDKYEIFASSIEAIEQALKAPTSGSLAAKEQFQTGIDVVPRPNAGYVYLDWAATQGILERQLPVLKLFEIAGASFFSNLQSLTVSSYPSEAGVLKGGVFVQLHQ